jgi:hypothetical protein
MGYGSRIPNRAVDSQGLPKLRARRQNQLVRSEPRRERPERGTKWNKWWTTASASGAPLRGLNILKLCIWVPTGRFRSRRSMWPGTKPFGFSCQGLPKKDTWNHMVWIWPRGALAPVWSYGATHGLVGSHLWTVTQAPLWSWLSTMVPSLRPLASSRS